MRFVIDLVVHFFIIDFGGQFEICLFEEFEDPESQLLCPLGFDVGIAGHPDLERGERTDRAGDQMHILMVYPITQFQRGCRA